MLASTEERESSDSLTWVASSSVPDWNPPCDKSSYDPENVITPWFKSTVEKYHEFILDTTSRESVISLGNLELFFPSAKPRPATRIVKCAMDQRIPFLGTAVIPVYSASGKPINCEFHISEESSYSLIGLKVICELGPDLPTNNKRYPGVEVLDGSPRLAAMVEATGSQGGRGGPQVIRDAHSKKKQRSQTDVVTELYCFV